MEKVNSELMVRNCYIMEQNDKLKKAAELLQQERQRLLSQLNAHLTSSSDHHQQYSKDKQAAGSSASLGSTATATTTTQASSE